MESLFADAEIRGVDVFDHEGRRLQVRPLAPISKNGGHPTRRKGQAVEDLGSGFVKGDALGNKGKARATGRRPQIQASALHDIDHSDSGDELDCLSSSQYDSGSDTRPPVRKNSKGKLKEHKDGYVDDKGRFHPYDQKFKSKTELLKSLKFNKNKKTTDGAADPMPSNASSSTLPILKEHMANRDLLAGSFSGSSMPQKKINQSSFDRADNHASRSIHNNTPTPSRRMPLAHSSNPPQDRTTTEKTRPKPRPLRHVASSRDKQQSFPDTDNDVPLSPAWPHTISEPRPFPLSPPESENVSPVKTPQSPPRVTKLTAAAFPQLSPVASPARLSKFQSSTPLASQEKYGTAKKKLSHQDPKRKGPITQVLPTTPKTATWKKMKDASAFPALSPLSSLAISANELSDKPESNQKSRSRYRYELEDRGSDIKELQSSSDRPKAQPFPMSTQVLNSIGSPDILPAAGPSRLGKRSFSDGSDNEQKRKRTRKNKRNENIELIPLDDYAYDEDDDTLMISPSTDPRTLCPYCDLPLPSSPTSLLMRLFAATAKKSSPDPRPTNPLGRKAPFAVFISVCQRHRFESQILPEAEQKGWPKMIEWTKLGERVDRMKIRLRALIDDAEEVLPDGEEEDEGSFFFTEDEEKSCREMKKGARSSRSSCVFWREVMAEVKKKGSRAVAGVRGQFASFEKTQPGYYGELGFVIIHQTLYDLFPPASIDPNLISPLTMNEFIQRILVPEVGVRLIMEDQSLEGEEGMETAVRILRESANYGVAMFPEDGGEWDVGGSGRGNGRKGRKEDVDEEMGVADRIVMERARKRRKELEEEEGEGDGGIEMEMGGLEVVSDMDGKLTRPVLRGKKQPGLQKKGKGKAKEVTPPPVIIPRPKPRPLGKTSSSASVLTNDIAPRRSQSREEDIDWDVAETDVPLELRTKRKPSRHSPTASDLEQQTDIESDTEKRTRLTVAVSSGSTFLDLCSTDDEVRRQDGKTAGRVTKVTTKRPLHEPIPEADDTEDDSVESVISLGTPVAKSVEHDDELEETPRPPGRSYPSRTPSATESSFLPLMAAGGRRRGSGNTSDVDPSKQPPASRNTKSRYAAGKGSNSWLLSDSSQSSESHEH